MAIGRRFDISLGLDIGSAITASERLIAKQREIAAAALAAAKAQEEAHARSAQQTQAMYNAAFAQIAQGAARMAMEVARSGSAAIDAATGKSQATADKFAGTRGSLRELANLQGMPNDAVFQRAFAAQNVRTGMTPQESIAFQAQALNSGAQYIDTPQDPNRNMAPALARKYIEQAGTLAISRGLQADVAGDLAGRVLGFRSYKKEGAAGPSAALSTVNQVMAILDAGVGQAPELAEQFNMLSATSLDATGADRGAFTNAADVATAVSIASQKVPGRAFTGTQSAIKQLRNFDNPLVQAAGITPTDTFEQALRKLAPVVTERAKQYGVKPIDVLMKGKSEASEAGFEDDLGAQMVETFISQGIEGNLFNKRRQVGDAAAEAGQAERKIAQFRGSTEGVARTRKAEAEAVDVERGLKTERMTILRQEGVNRLRSRGELDTTTAEFQNYLAKGLSAGLLPDRQQALIDDEVRAIVNERLPKGVSPVPRFQALTGIMPTEENKVGAINAAIAGAQAAGVDVLRSKAERDAVPPALPSEAPASGPGRGGLN